MLTTTESSLRNAKLLVVDDSQANRRLLDAIFRSEGCEVALAESGDQALPALREHTPDIVLLDVRMPGLDGIQTLRRLRPVAPDIPILMLTSYGDHDAAVEATSLGANDFIGRPISNDDLVARVAHAFEHRKLLEDLESLHGKVSDGQFVTRLRGPSAATSTIVDSIRRVAKSNFPFRDYVLAPLGIPLYAAMLWRSWFRHTVLRQVVWKGREIKSRV